MTLKNYSEEKIALRKKYPPTYGRKKSRSLSPTQQKLLETYFDPNIISPEKADIERFKKESKGKKVILEIGFGGGEHLVYQAMENPDALLIGCEVYLNSFVVCLQSAHKENLSNIRFYNNDSRYLLEHLPPKSIDKVFILFPDPWPKKKQFKRRIVNQQLLDMLHPLLKDKAVIRLGTDIDSYFESMLEVFSSDKRFKLQTAKKDFAKVPKDHILTKYQAKALEAGRIPRFIEYVKYQ